MRPWVVILTFSLYVVFIVSSSLTMSSFRTSPAASASSQSRWNNRILPHLSLFRSFSTDSLTQFITSKRVLHWAHWCVCTGRDRKEVYKITLFPLPDICSMKNDIGRRTRFPKTLTTPTHSTIIPAATAALCAASREGIWPDVNCKNKN